MISRYLRLRQYCQANEWAAGLSAFLLVGLLGTIIYLSLEKQSLLEQWLGGSVLVNGLILFSTALLVSALSLSLVCLSFSPCSIQDRTERVIHVHQHVMTDALKVVKNLGVNPKRQRTPDRSASS
jgi:hypothetical protein